MPFGLESQIFVAANLAAVPERTTLLQYALLPLHYLLLQFAYEVLGRPTSICVTALTWAIVVSQALDLGKDMIGYIGLTFFAAVSGCNLVFGNNGAYLIPPGFIGFSVLYAILFAKYMFGIDILKAR